LYVSTYKNIVILGLGVMCKIWYMYLYFYIFGLTLVCIKLIIDIQFIFNSAIKTSLCLNMNYDSLNQAYQ